MDYTTNIFVNETNYQGNSERDNLSKITKLNIYISMNFNLIWILEEKLNLGQSVDNSKPILAIIIEALLKGGLGSLEGTMGQAEEAKNPDQTLAEKLSGAQEQISEVKNRLESQPRSNLSDEANDLGKTDTLKKKNATGLQNQFEKPEIEIEDMVIDGNEDIIESSRRREKLELQVQSEVQPAENEKSESKKSKILSKIDPNL